MAGSPGVPAAHDRYADAMAHVCPGHAAGRGLPPGGWWVLTTLSCTKCGATRTIRWKLKAGMILGGTCQCGGDAWRVE